MQFTVTPIDCAITQEENWYGIDEVDMVRAAWLMGKHSLFGMFNLYPENVPKEFKIDIICDILDSGLRT